MKKETTMNISEYSILLIDLHHIIITITWCEDTAEYSTETLIVVPRTLASHILDKTKLLKAANDYKTGIPACNYWLTELIKEIR